MNLAKISKNGQITVPVEIREHLGLKPGDKIFYTSEDGKVTISNASIIAIERVQLIFANAAEVLNLKTDEDVQALVNEIRKHLKSIIF